MRLQLFFACVFCLSVPAFAQNASRVDVTDHALTQQAARTPAVASSFKALQPVLKVDQTVRVNQGIVDSEWNGFLVGVAAGAGLACARGCYPPGALAGALGGAMIGYTIDWSIHTGTSITGKVVSISTDQLVISRPRFFRRRVDLTFTEDSVTSIRLVDSEWNGFVIGAAAGSGYLAALIEIACRRESCDRGDREFAWGLGSFLVGFPAAALGAGIDSLITQRVYDRPPPQRPRVTIAPLLGRHQKGVVAQVRF